MKNADRINFYLAGLRQPGDGRDRARDRAPASEALARPGAGSDNSRSDNSRSDGIQAGGAQSGGTRSGGTRSGGEPSRTESQVAKQRIKDIQARRAARLPEAGSVEAFGSADGGGFAAALRKQLQEGGEGELAATLDQAQLRRLLERLDHRRERFGLLDLSPETARKRQRQLIFGLLLAALIIALQASAVVWLYQRAEQLLGRPLSPALLLTATPSDLDVVFRPSASAGDIAVLLRELQLHVVDGPASSGRYVLRPEAGIARSHALNALRDRRDLVYSAEAAY